jgi:flagellar protein FlaJ
MAVKNIRLDRRLLLSFVPNVAVAAILIYVGFVFFPKSGNIHSAMIILGGAIVFLPFMLTRYIAYSRKKQAEDMFPIFLRDFVEAVKGGLTVPAAFQMIAKNDYGSLSPHIKKIAAQLEWGIPVDKVLMSFSKSVKSALIARVVSSVVESHRFGGRLSDTFEALSKTAVEVDRLKAERRLFLQSQMLTGYIIYFVFLGVIISLELFLLPSITKSTPIGIRQSTISPEQIAVGFREIFRNLIFIQGFFAGLSVGKMSEGALIAGLKHSAIMMTVGGGLHIVASSLLA